MSLMPYTLFPRSMFNMDSWLSPQANFPSNTLDLFDPFDELDHAISRNLQWINKPDFISPFPLLPRVPQKYRITVDCAGYQPQSIKTEVKNNVLTVSAKEEEKKDNQDYSIRELRKTYNLPKNCEADKLVSFMTAGGQLVIEVPLKEKQQHLNTDLFPKILDNRDGSKTVSLKFQVPENINPEHVHVHIKDRDLIVKAQEKVNNPDLTSKFYYYKRTTLPENTKFDELKCSYDKGQLSVTAPLDLDFKLHKKVPIEIKPTYGVIKQ